MTQKLVQIRGGSGSGKSTLVRRYVEDNAAIVRKHMMSTAANWGLSHIDCAASRPFALEVVGSEREDNLPSIIVPGHYEAAGGGGDMIKSTYHIYDVCRKALALGCDVLVESLFASKDTKATEELLHWCQEEGVLPYIILLDIGEEAAYAAVQERRRALGKEERVLRAHHNDYHSVHVSNLKYYDRWNREGLAIMEKLSREEAAVRVRELLG